MNGTVVNASDPLDYDDNCFYGRQLRVQLTKVVIVMILGTGIATMSFLENVFLFVIFVRQRGIYRSNLIYPTVLAILDSVISVAYLMLMSVGVYMDYFDSTTMYFAWISYLQGTFVVSHVSMAASGFLIVFWTMERWLCIVKSSDQLSSPLRRGAAVLAAVLLGIALKSEIYWELTIIEDLECDNQARYVVRQSPLARNWYYGTIFMFYVRNAFTVFLPFIVLATLNISIIRHLRRTTQAARVARQMLLSTCVTLGVPQGSQISAAAFPPPGDFHNPPSSAAFSPQSQAPKPKKSMRRASYYPEMLNGMVSLAPAPVMPSSRAAATKQTAKDSIRTMITIVSLYLLGNCLNVGITAIEHVDKSFLYQPGIVEIYDTMSDVISLLTVLCSSLRLPLYMVANRVIRNEVIKTLDSICCGARIRKSSRQLLRWGGKSSTTTTNCSYHLVGGGEKENGVLLSTPLEGRVVGRGVGRANGLRISTPPPRFPRSNGHSCVLEESELGLPLESRV